MIGIFYLFLFYFLGECIAWLTGHFIPGSVIGMALFFAALYFRIIRKEDVRGAATFLLDHILLFFIPICVGLMTSWPLISEHWLAIVASCVLSTLLIITIVGHLQQALEKRRNQRIQSKDNSEEI